MSGTLPDHVTQLGPYHLKRLLGAGAFADVYEAVHTTSGHPFALKVFTPIGAEAGFVRELAVSFAHHHPNLVETHDLGYGAHPFLALHLARGGTLRARMAQGRLQPQALRHVVLEVGRGLHALHERGIVHGDVKPENVLFDEDGDFAQARVADYGASCVRGTAQRAGSPAYGTPETNGGLSTFAQDNYALALVAFEAITGTRSIKDSFANVTDHDVRGLESRVLGKLRRALAVSPRLRFPSTVALVHALDQALAGPHELARVSLDNDNRTRRCLASGAFAVRRGDKVEIRDAYGLREHIAFGPVLDLAISLSTPTSSVVHGGSTLWVNGQAFASNLEATSRTGPCTIRRFAGDAIAVVDADRRTLRSFPANRYWARVDEPLRALFSVFTTQGDIVLGIPESGTSVYLISDREKITRAPVPRGVSRMHMSLHDAIIEDKSGARTTLVSEAPIEGSFEGTFRKEERL